MSVKVTIVDYGVGNLYSVRAALEHCGAEVELATNAGKVESADRLLLPGVGAFEDATVDMRDCSLIEPVLEFARNDRPLMGICLGMQMLFDQSEEFGTHKGLGLITGTVLPIPETDRNGAPHCIPHVGWNEIEAATGADWSAGLLKGIEPGTSVYYSHSFRALPADPGPPHGVEMPEPSAGQGTEAPQPTEANPVVTPEAPAPAAQSDDGCGCAAHGSPPTSLWPLALALFFVLWGRQRGARPTR